VLLLEVKVSNFPRIQTVGLSNSFAAEDSMNYIEVPVLSATSGEGVLLIAVSPLEADVWIAAIKPPLHDAAKSSIHCTAAGLNAEEDSLQRTITVRIEGEEHILGVPRGCMAAEDAAVRFVQSVGFSEDYAPAVEMELLRAQVRLLEGECGAFCALKSAYLAAQLQNAQCIERVEMAAAHIAKLSASLSTMETIIPLLLPEAAAVGADLSDTADILRELCARYSLDTGNAGDGRITPQKWQTLQQEERLMFGTAHSVTSGDPERWSADLTWRARYMLLRDTASHLQQERATAEAALDDTRTELRQLSAGSNPALEGALQENQSLREQTVRLRGEILRLRDHIAEVKTAAAQAMHSVSAFGRDVVRLPAASASPGGESGLGSRPLSSWRAEVESQQQVLHPHAWATPEVAAAAGQEQDVSLLQEGYSPEVLIQARRRSQLQLDNHPAVPALTHPAVDHRAGPESKDTENALDLALRAAHVPIVCDRLLRLLFDRYSSQDGKFVMNSFRYLRCLKECGVTANEDEAALGNTRWLSYGVVSIVFNEALKVRTEDASPAAATAATAAAVTAYARSTSTVLTLKGAADPRASAISHQQFLCALRSLALRLYADVIEAEFGVPVELLKSPVKDSAAYQALELMVQDKLVPLAVRQGITHHPVNHAWRPVFYTLYYVVQTSCPGRWCTWRGRSSPCSRSRRPSAHWQPLSRATHWPAGSRTTRSPPLQYRLAHLRLLEVGRGRCTRLGASPRRT
jgi:uncharacterized protein YukE